MRMTDGPTARPNKLFRNLNAKFASIPMILTALGRLRRRDGLDDRLTPSPIRGCCRG